MVDDYPAFLRKVEALKRRAAEAGGELKAVLSALRQKHGYKTLQEAEVSLPKLEEEERQIAADYTRKKMELEKEFKSELEGL
jgi:hypothetical protein